MKLSRYEQETIIHYNEEDDTASVYTYNGRLIEKLKNLAEKYPDKVKQEQKEYGEAASYIVPKRCISVREPYSDARRAADSRRAKKAGLCPPDRSICSKAES